MSVSKRRAQAVKRRVNVERYITRLLDAGRLTRKQVEDYYRRVGR